MGANKVVQKSKEAKMKAAMAGGKSKKKKWSKGKVKEKLANFVQFDKPTYDRLLEEIPKANSWSSTSISAFQSSTIQYFSAGGRGSGTVTLHADGRGSEGLCSDGRGSDFVLCSVDGRGHACPAFCMHHVLSYICFLFCYLR